MNDNVKIKVILGSTRDGRFGDKPARWIADEAKKQAGVEVELLDLKDYPLPFVHSATLPAMQERPYPDAAIEAWAKKIEDGDAYVVVTPEYNFGPPAVLKNALDVLYKEWNKKPMAFVSYGGVGGARAIQQLRQTLPQFQMVSIATSVHILNPVYMAVKDQPVPADPKLFEPVAPAAERLITDLLWWARVLKNARSQK